MNKINFSNLKKTLTKKELQNVLGGSGLGDVNCGSCKSSGEYACSCNGAYVGDANSAECCICYCV